MKTYVGIRVDGKNEVFVHHGDGREEPLRAFMPDGVEPGWLWGASSPGMMHTAACIAADYAGEDIPAGEGSAWDRCPEHLKLLARCIMPRLASAPLVEFQVTTQELRLLIRHMRQAMKGERRKRIGLRR